MIELNYKEIGKRIKLRRKELGLRQYQLAEMVELSEGSVSRYEHGKIENASTTKLNDFAIALKVSPAWLIGFKLEDEFDLKFKELMKKASVLDDDKKKLILDIVEIQINQFIKEV